MMDACNEIYEKNKEVDPDTAIMKVKEKFDKLWKEHDVNNTTVMEKSEAYQFIQDLTRGD